MPVRLPRAHHAPAHAHRRSSQPALRRRLARPASPLVKAQSANTANGTNCSASAVSSRSRPQSAFGAATLPASSVSHTSAGKRRSSSLSMDPTFTAACAPRTSPRQRSPTHKLLTFRRKEFEPCIPIITHCRRNAHMAATVIDYLPLHNWFDASKSTLAHFTHRALNHHREGVAAAVRQFDATICNADNAAVSVEALALQHLAEDMSIIPVGRRLAPAHRSPGRRCTPDASAPHARRRRTRRRQRTPLSDHPGCGAAAP